MTVPCTPNWSQSHSRAEDDFELILCLHLPSDVVTNVTIPMGQMSSLYEKRRVWMVGWFNKALALQVWGPEFDTQNLYKNKNTWEWPHTERPVMPAFRKWPQRVTGGC